jgi:hypothetical protein
MMTTSGEPSRQASSPPSAAGEDEEKAVDPQRHSANVAASVPEIVPNARFVITPETTYYTKACVNIVGFLLVLAPRSFSFQRLAPATKKEGECRQAANRNVASQGEPMNGVC